MGYKISEFSNISGVSASNIRYYEQRGFPLSERSDSGYRQYQFEDSYRINTFNALLAHGFSVSEAIALMNPHPAEDLTKRLQEKNQIIEDQILMLQKKLEWNRRVQHVLEHIEEELTLVHEVTLPELCYLKCTEGYDHTPSLENGEQIAKWVDLLPLGHYAARGRLDGSFTLGMITTLDVAQKYGMVGPGTQKLQGGEYYALLLRGEDAEKEIKEDGRILTMIQNGYSFPETFFHVYMMLNTEEFGSDLNYVFLKK